MANEGPQISLVCFELNNNRVCECSNYLHQFLLVMKLGSEIFFASIHNEVDIVSQGKHHTAGKHRMSHNQSMVGHLAAKPMDISLVSHTNCSEAIHLRGIPFH